MCAFDLLKKLFLQPDVIHKPAETGVDVSAHIQHEQTILVDLSDAIRAPEAEVKEAAARFLSLALRSGGDSPWALLTSHARQTDSCSAVFAHVHLLDLRQGLAGELLSGMCSHYRANPGAILIA
jgi:hypothetical protein